MNRLEASPKVRDRPEAASDALLPLGVFLPTWTERRRNENARAGRIPGVMKVGRCWMMTRSAFERWTATLGAPSSNDAHAPTVDDAAADLRRRGIL